MAGQSDNPFAQFAPTTAAPAAAPQDNPFAQFKQPAPAEAPAEAPADDAKPVTMQQWSTKVGNGADAKVITWYAPAGADKDTVRRLGAQAGVDRINERSVLQGNGDALRASAAQEQKDNSYGTVGTMLENGVHFAFPFVDRIAAGIDSLLHGDQNGSYSDKVNFLHDRLDNSYENHTTAGRVGDAGMTALTLPLAVGSKIATGGNFLTKSLKAGALGSAVSSVYNYGNNRPDDPFNGAGPAAAIGLGLGALAPTAGKVLGTVASRLDERLGVSDKAIRAYRFLTGNPEPAEDAATRRAVTAFGSRTSQDPTAMAGKADTFRAAGTDPTLVNVVDEAGRGQIAAAARRPGPGREIAQRAAEAKALNMPDAMDRNMQTALLGTSDDPAMRQQLSRNSTDVLNDLTENRSAEMDKDMAPARGDTVPLTPEIVSILDTAEGRSAINRAMRTVQDPDTRQAMAKLPSMLKSLGQIDPRMPQQVRDQITQQIVQGNGGLTVDVADRIARKFNAMADTADTDAVPVLRQFARTIRDTAKQNSPGYAQALDNYAARSKSRDAIGVGEEFLKPDTDNFNARAAKLTDDPNRPMTVEGDNAPPSPFSGGDDVMTPVGPGVVADAHPVPGHTQVSLDSGSNVHIPHDQVQVLPPAGPEGDVVSDAERFAAMPPASTTPPEARVPAPASAPAEPPPPEQPGGPATIPTPTNRQLALMGSRRAVQRAVGENTSAAPGIARKIAYAPEQASRTNALMGPMDAEKLRNAMAVTAEDVRNFADIAPRTGSATALRLGDDAAAGQILEAAASAKTGRFNHALTVLKNLGMRDADAQQLVKVAVDPTRTDELVNILAKHMQSREAAARLARTISNVAQAATGTELSGSE